MAIFAMEDLRYEQRAQFYVHNETRPSEAAEQAIRTEGTLRPEGSLQNTTRLRQIEQEIQDRGRANRDDRDS